MKKLGDRLTQYKKHPDFNQRMSNYVIEREGVEETDDDEELHQYFGDLQIDPTSETYNSYAMEPIYEEEVFLTSF